MYGQRRAWPCQIMKKFKEENSVHSFMRQEVAIERINEQQHPAPSSLRPQIQTGHPNKYQFASAVFKKNDACCVFEAKS